MEADRFGVGSLFHEKDDGDEEVYDMAQMTMVSFK